MLSPQERAEYEQTGLLKIPRAIPAETASRMAERIRAHLATEESIRRNREQAFLAERPVGLQALTRTGSFDDVGAGSIPTVLDELYGRDGWARPRHWGRALVTFKVSDAHWDVPTRGWHVDGWPYPDGQPSGVTVFVILAPLRPEGGGTLVLSGTHQLLQRLADATPPVRGSKPARRELGSRSPWLGDLWSPRHRAEHRRTTYVDTGAVVDGVPVRLVELTGEPGDAFLMRTDTLHTIAPNVRPDPRLMLAQGCRIADSAGNLSRSR